jgi:FKBP12-rapamycin complex-associated protein
MFSFLLFVIHVDFFHAFLTLIDIFVFSSHPLRWLPHTDTLHALIKEYRDARKILLNIEHRLMLQMAPDYQHLTLMQKVEVFEYALANTTGQDLYKVLWLKSQNSEV